MRKVRRPLIKTAKRPKSKVISKFMKMTERLRMKRKRNALIREGGRPSALYV